MTKCKSSTVSKRHKVPLETVQTGVCTYDVPADRFCCLIRRGASVWARLSYPPAPHRGSIPTSTQPRFSRLASLKSPRQRSYRLCVLSRLCTGVPSTKRTRFARLTKAIDVAARAGYCKFFACFPELDQSHRGLPVLTSRSPESLTSRLQSTSVVDSVVPDAEGARNSQN